MAVRTGSEEIGMIALPAEEFQVPHACFSDRGLTRFQTKIHMQSFWQLLIPLMSMFHLMSTFHSPWAA